MTTGVMTAHGEHKYVEQYTMYRIAQNVAECI